MSEMINCVKDALKLKTGDQDGCTYKNLRKLNAKYLLEAGNYDEAAYNLAEAIAPSARTMAVYRYERAICEDSKELSLKFFSDQLNDLARKTTTEDSEDSFTKYLSSESERYALKIGREKKLPDGLAKEFLDVNLIKHSNDDVAGIIQMKDMLSELPKEWTVIQLTANCEPSDQWQSLKSVKTRISDFFLTILSTGKMVEVGLEPFTVRILPEPVKYGEKPLFEELQSTLEQNSYVLENNLRVTNNSLTKYWEKRNECDLRMKSVISTMDKKWLRGWRCLLSGQLDSKCKALLQSYVEGICKTNNFRMSTLQQFLLHSLIGGCFYLSLGEATIIVRQIFIDYSPIDETNEFNCQKCTSKSHINHLCKKCDVKEILKSADYRLFKKCFIEAIERIKSLVDLPFLMNASRGPIILLIDEKLDTFPWEVLPVMNNKPVTRIECLSFAYSLYKKHQDRIVNGYFEVMPNVCNYIINPGGDLSKMEKRMSCFINYWCTNWRGEKNEKPSEDLYEKYLQNSDIFLYCGHGDGSNYIGCTVERLTNVKSMAVLSGCGSVALRHVGPRFLPVPIHSHFHIASCPSVIGMLWEVTDLEVDKVTSMLLSLFIPSTAETHWGNVDKTKWTHGKIEHLQFTKTPRITELDPQKCTDKKFAMEPNLLKALGQARRSTDYVMISASIVSRGLPVVMVI